MTLPDPALLADWNAANARARRAYHDEPFALADLLERSTCTRCADGAHRRCTGRMVKGGTYRCLCEHESHREGT